MAAESPKSPIELPGLVTSRLGLLSADVQVGTGSPDLVHPQLLLEGGDDAFEHSFRDGRLNLDEKSDGNGNVTVVSTGGGQSSVFIGGGNFSGIIVSGGSVRVNGREVFGDSESIVSAARRRASLLLPPGHLASHDIDSAAGDIELEGLTARVLKVASQSGDIAVRGVTTESVTLNTMSGDVEIEDTRSETPVSAKTMSGDIDVSGSEAPSWRLNTMSGDVKVRSTSGEVDAKSMSGRTRVSQ